MDRPPAAPDGPGRHGGHGRRGLPELSRLRARVVRPPVPGRHPHGHRRPADAAGGVRAHRPRPARPARPRHRVPDAGAGGAAAPLPPLPARARARDGAGRGAPRPRGPGRVRGRRRGDAPLHPCGPGARPALLRPRGLHARRGPGLGAGPGDADRRAAPRPVALRQGDGAAGAGQIDDVLMMIAAAVQATAKTRERTKIRRARASLCIPGGYPGCRALQRPECEAEHGGARRVAGLGPGQVVADRREGHPAHEEARAGQPAPGGGGGAPPGQRRLVEGPRRQVEAHPDRDDGEAQPPEVPLGGQQQVHDQRPEREQAQRHGGREARHGEQRHPDRAVERRPPLRRLQARQVGQQRRLHGLEELERDAGDEEGVEHDPRGRARRDEEHRGVEQRLLGELDDRDGAREAPVIARAGGHRGDLVGPAAAGSGPPAQRPRHHEEGRQGRRGDPERHGGLPAGQAREDREREEHPRRRLEEHEAPVEAEPLLAREDPAGEVRGGVGDGRREQDPEQRGIAEGVLERAAEGEHERGEDRREGELDGQGPAQGMAVVLAAGAAGGDGPRQELLHGPVHDRQRDEEDGPQQRDRAVVLVAEDVRGEREVGEGHQARGRDPHGEDPRPAAVPAGAGRRAGPGRPALGGLADLRRQAGRAASSRGTASGPPRRCRARTAAGRRTAWTSGSRGRACCPAA
ncbi:MAG: hypothetical protein AVDCRST_MAG13-364 [uncultured Solirubrobacteraceae bacterium]|uniref:Uncharacterized protein n=1 Tax=uncultured Solirubrobacteraceae bacterium TaxID=1162706 RepID=A0A6J4RI87_9ACTN|nr:MAG: hypothetical protein AVDCRST_MAG13-364 [uncultured Solirubrobacteraceae bacterium]